MTSLGVAWTPFLVIITVTTVCGCGTSSTGVINGVINDKSLPEEHVLRTGSDFLYLCCRYVGGVVSYYYLSDDDVIRDSELQSWINEIIVFGRLGDEKKGLNTEYFAVFLFYSVTTAVLLLY